MDVFSKQLFCMDCVPIHKIVFERSNLSNYNESVPKYIYQKKKNRKCDSDLYFQNRYQINALWWRGFKYLIKYTHRVYFSCAF